MGKKSKALRSQTIFLENVKNKEDSDTPEKAHRLKMDKSKMAQCERI